MESIYIPQLIKAPQQTKTVEIDAHLPDLETLTPVHGTVTVSHRGNFLEVSGQAETIVTLCCDRCLQQYNHRLKVNTSEIILLQEPVEEDYGNEEHEILYEDLTESLPPNGYFSPTEWLYEQLCLELPQRQLCDRACQGIQIQDTAPEPGEKIDDRWASLESLRNHLSNN